MLTTIADNLKVLMIKRGYTQKDIACMTKVAPNTVSGWLKHGRMPSEDMLHTLARILEVPVGVLVDDDMRAAFLQGEKPLHDNTTTILTRSIELLRAALDSFEWEIRNT